MRFWDVLLEYLVLAHVLLPWVIVAIVGCLRSRGMDATRFVVLQGCLLWVSCGIAIVMRFDSAMPLADPPAISQMVKSIAWRPLADGSPIMLGVGVDGLSLWYLVMLPWLALSIVLWESARRTWVRRDFITLLFAAAGIALALAAMDFLLLAIGGTISLLSVVLWNRPSLVSARSRGEVIWGVAVAAAFLFGTAVAVVAAIQVQVQNHVADPALTTGINDLVFGLPRMALDSERAHVAWKQLAGSMFLAWSVAILLCVGSWPMQESLIRSLLRMECGPRLVIVCGLLPLGNWLLMRCFLPLLGEFVGGGQGWVIGPVLVSLMWQLAMLTAVDSASEGMLRLTMSAQLLAIVGGITGTEAGICGGIILSLTSGWAYAAWCLGAPVDESASPHPVQWLALLLLAGCPGGGVFAGFWLIAAGIMFGANQGIMSGVVLLATLGLLWMLLAGSVFRIARSRVAESPRSAVKPFSLAGAGLMLAAIVLSGVQTAKVERQIAHDVEIVSRQVLHLASPGAP